MAGTRNRTPPDARLTEAVAHVLQTAGVAPRQTLCVAFSGGVDSTVLLHLLAGLRGRFGFELAAAHVHHGLSTNADAWLACCARQCAALGVPFHPFHVAVPRDHPAGLEAAARELRHAALSRVACEWLVFGHHLDDQAETMLFRLLRGTGLRGAGAMRAIDGGTPGWLRPLLGVRRSDIVRFAQAALLDWVEDESNADPGFARNFLRHRVLPLAAEAFPGAVPALARAADHFREAGELLDDLAALDAAACGEDSLVRERVLDLPDARLRNLLRYRIRSMGYDAPPRARLVEAVRQLRDAGERPLFLPLGALNCCAYRGEVWLEAGFDGGAAEPVAWRGERSLSWGSGEVRFEPAIGAGIGRAALEAREAVLMPRWPGLTLREAVERPRRTFKNLCQEAGIPAWLRPRLPVLRVGGEAAWIAEIGVAAEFRCAPGEEGVLPAWRRRERPRKGRKG
ncbi:tRNA lysidine(34) synthetase TilS [Aromatoleum sp.]|uniref:tRNA lysidine(34) synthetase TilS n=1 Tax=Aromatoleum sp. TaxID=2307007 RepID=UPI002FCC6BE2